MIMIWELDMHSIAIAKYLHNYWKNWRHRTAHKPDKYANYFCEVSEEQLLRNQAYVTVCLTCSKQHLICLVTFSVKICISLCGIFVICHEFSWNLQKAHIAMAICTLTKILQSTDHFILLLDDTCCRLVSFSPSISQWKLQIN